MDRTKEPGAAGEPLYMDVVTALAEAGRTIRVVGGRYGLASKEFTPAMAKAIYDNMAAAAPKNHFTVGINDDVTHTSLAVDPEFNIEPANTVRALFFGLGADGTVGANHNSIRIIGTETPNSAQGFFVYDSKKSGSTTTSHLRFGPDDIHAPYLIQKANFIACHQWVFTERYNMLEKAEDGAVFLLNSAYGAGRGVGSPAAASCRNRSSRRTSSCTSSTRTRWPRTPAWACASTRSCRPASLPSRACCRATRRSRRSRNRSSTPTGAAAKPSCSRTLRPSTTPCRTCTRSITRSR